MIGTFCFQQDFNQSSRLGITAHYFVQAYYVYWLIQAYMDCQQPFCIVTQTRQGTSRSTIHEKPSTRIAKLDANVPKQRQTWSIGLNQNWIYIM